MQSSKERKSGLRVLLTRLTKDASGQDLIEYALLAGVVAAGLAVLTPSLQTGLQRSFTTWGTQRNNLWIPQDPVTP